MRLRVSLRAPPPIVMPVNHAYHLGALICHLLARASSDYAAFLHRQGYGEWGRRFKLFTFISPRQEDAGGRKTAPVPTPAFPQPLSRRQRAVAQR